MNRSREGESDDLESPNLHDLPKGWCCATLAQVLEGIEAGKSFECLTRQAVDGEWGVIKVSAMTWGEFDERENKAIPPGKKIEPQHEIHPGDLLLSRSNTVELVGATVLVRACRPKLLLSDKSMRLLVSQEINRNWLQKMLSSASIRKQLSAVATGSSNSMRNVSQDKVLSIRLLLPPVAEQGRIVQKIEELFSKLDAGVTALERVQIALKRYRAAVLKAAVEGQLTAAWRAQHPDIEPASALLQRILSERRRKWEQEQRAKYAATGKEPPKGWQAKYKEPAGPEADGLPELPQSWCRATVEQLGQVQLGRQRSPKNQSIKYPTKYIRAANITERGLDVTDLLDMEFQPHEQATYRLDVGDVVLSEASGSPDQVGKPAVWKGEIEDCCFQNTVLRLRPLGMDSRYPLTVFRHFYSNKVFAQIAAGVGINHLSAAKFSVMPVPLAPIAEQQQIVAEVERRLSIVDRLEAQVEANLARAARLRQSILKRAFEGRLVPQDPRDEPAELLLERIRAAHSPSEGRERKPRGNRGRTSRTAQDANS